MSFIHSSPICIPQPGEEEMELEKMSPNRQSTRPTQEEKRHPLDKVLRPTQIRSEGEMKQFYKCSLNELIN